MAIRPVDLQLAYLAAPQNAAVVSNAESAPQAAQQAAASAFAAQVTQREEHVTEPVKVEGGKVKAREDREQPEQHAGRRRQTLYQPEPAEPEVPPEAGEGHHIIDTTA
jgi:hypothetical protein